MIVTFFGFVCIWLLSQELTGRVLSYVGILMLVLESVLQILRHQFMLTSMLQEFKNTPQKILMEYGSIILLFLFVWWYVFYRQHSGKMTETELAKQQELNKKLSLILEADFGLLLRLQRIFRTVVYTFDDDQQCVSASGQTYGRKCIVGAGWRPIS